MGFLPRLSITRFQTSMVKERMYTTSDKRGSKFGRNFGWRKIHTEEVCVCMADTGAFKFQGLEVAAGPGALCVCVSACGCYSRPNTAVGEQVFAHMGQQVPRLLFFPIQSGWQVVCPNGSIASILILTPVHLPPHGILMTPDFFFIHSQVSTRCVMSHLIEHMR
jgi:hypothetical protein